jgi:hypothetical protein
MERLGIDLLYLAPGANAQYSAAGGEIARTLAT